MEKVDINELKDIKPLFEEEPKFISFATIIKVMFDGKYYIMKDFNKNILISKPFLRKYDKLSLIHEPALKVPKILVMKDNKPYSYLAEYVDAKNISKLNNRSMALKIRMLKDAKDNLLLMHDYGIVHADIHAGNVLFNTNGTYYIDFDNSTYKGGKTIKNLSSDFAMEFIKKYGVCKELDIAMFNLLTFYIINSSIYFLTRRDIIKGNYGRFYDADSIKICNNLLLEDKHATTDFLIDAIKL